MKDDKGMQKQTQVDKKWRQTQSEINADRQIELERNKQIERDRDFANVTVC